MANWDYHILTEAWDPRSCYIDRISGTIIRNWRLIKGVLIGADFPPDATFRMSKQGGNIITDFLDNALSLMMISSKVRNLMNEEGGSDVEYLPFVLLNKKGKVVSTEYCVANLLGGVDCFDPVRSDYEEEPLSPSQVGNLYSLNLVFDKIPEDKKLFRLKQKLTTVIIRSDFLEVLRKNNVAGIATLDLNTELD